MLVRAVLQSTLVKEVDVHPLDQDQRAKVPEGANKTTFTIEDDVKNLSFVISGQITPKVKKKYIYISYTVVTFSYKCKASNT